MTHKLLLADDSVTIQRVIELTFADEDVDVTTVGDGQMAIDRLDTDPPDIILADVDMPKRDGYEVAAYVRSRPKLAHIPVVLLTGAFEPVDQARASAAGSTDVLAKPFEPQMVINRVKELLSRKRSDDRGHDELPQAMVAQAATFEMPNTSGGSAVAEDDAVSLDDYFDQLDAAFSTLQSGAAPAAEAPDLDWVAPTAIGTSIEASSITMPTPAPALIANAPAPPAVEAAVPFVQEVATPKPDETALPLPAASLDDQLDFSGLTDLHDQGAEDPAFDFSAITADPSPMFIESQPAIVPEPPALRPAGNPFASLSAAKAEAAARPPAPAISDDVIEEIVSRVLRRMSDNVVRETVASIVSETAERLVQEEISRIKDAQ